MSNKPCVSVSPWSNTSPTRPVCILKFKFYPNQPIFIFKKAQLRFEIHNSNALSPRAHFCHDRIIHLETTSRTSNHRSPRSSCHIHGPPGAACSITTTNLLAHSHWLANHTRGAFSFASRWLAISLRSEAGPSPFRLVGTCRDLFSRERPARLHSTRRFVTQEGGRPGVAPSGSIPIRPHSLSDKITSALPRSESTPTPFGYVILPPASIKSHIMRYSSHFLPSSMALLWHWVVGSLDLRDQGAGGRENINGGPATPSPNLWIFGLERERGRANCKLSTSISEYKYSCHSSAISRTNQKNSKDRHAIRIWPLIEGQC